MLSAITTILIITALFACTGFIAVYLTHAPWRSSAVGQTMMMLAASVVILCISGLIYSFFGGEAAIFPWVRLAVYVSLNIAWWRQLLILIKLQRSATAVASATPTSPLMAVQDPTEDEDKVDIA